MTTPDTRPPAHRYLLVALAAGAAGCGVPIVGEPNARDGSTGTAVASITSVPGGVRCVAIELRRGASDDVGPSELTFDVTSGEATTLSLGVLPAGPLSVRALAYDTSCEGVEGQGTASWVSDEVTVEVLAGRRAAIALAMRRNVDQRATLDFIKEPTALAGAVYSGAGIFGDGTLRAWGTIGPSLIGAPSSQGATRPLTVPGVSDAQLVALSGETVCVARAGGGVACAGRGYEGQLGDGTARYRWSIEATTTFTTRPVVRLVGASDDTTAGAFCAIDEGHQLWCWGSNVGGRIGPTVGPVLAPTRVAGSFTDVDVGESHAALVQTSGVIEVIGTFRGSLSSLRAVTGAAVTSNGGGSVCALLADGAVQCAGENGRGELGNGRTTASATPGAVQGLPAVRSLVGGYAHYCALSAAGEVWCWGANSFGQLGNGTAADATRPARVPGLSGVVSLSAGHGHTCALLADGSARCWGINSQGQLGDGTRVTRFVPAPVAR